MTASLGYLLLVAAGLYAALAWAARRGWLRRVDAVPAPAARAPVTVLKPLCGTEPRLYDNLRSYCTQDHPTFQLLFGLHRADDAALAVVERLQAEFPALDLGVFVDDRVHGINLKVSTLINLLPHARHDWLLLADSDIEAPPDLLRRMSAPLALPATGVVTCLYRGHAVGGVWSRIGAQFINDWFGPSVCLARRAGSTAYAFGAGIALRREVLASAGGFEAIVDCVADDWWLGEQTRRAGHVTVLSECAVRTDVVETSLRALAGRELRWLRAIRAVAPLGYAFSFVCWTTPMLVLGLSLTGVTPPALALAGVALAARLALSADAGDSPATRLGNALRVPLRDGLSLLLWALALTGTAVRWRGRSMKIATRPPPAPLHSHHVEMPVNAVEPRTLKTLFLQAPSFDGFDGGAGSRYQAKREIKSFWYPTWLAQPAALVPGSRVVDAPADELSVDETLAIAERYELVIIHTSTPSFPSDARFAERLKSRAPGVVIGMVGAKVAVDPSGALNTSTAVDFVAREEFDYTCAELAANDKPWSEITGISYRLADGRLQHNPPRATIEDMDALPFVAPVYRRDLTIENYFIGYLQHPYVSLYTGRGCRSKCTFCLWPQTVGGHRYRVRSAANVIEEARWIKANMPEVKELMFDDDTFTDASNMDRVHEIAIGLGKLGWTWSCNAKANVPYESLKLMKNNGLRLLLVGYESGDDGILHNIRKGMKAAIAERFTADCRRLGIVIHGTFILGLPGETRDTIEQTIEWAKRINPHTIQVSLAAPYPGTALYRQAVDNGWLAENDAVNLVNAQGVQLAALSYPHLSKDEIFGAMDRFYRRFYFRPTKIWEIVREMLTDWDMLKRRLREGVEFFRFLRERAVLRT